MCFVNKPIYLSIYHHIRQQLAILKNRRKSLQQSTDFYHDSHDSSSVDELLKIPRTQKAILQINKLRGLSVYLNVQIAVRQGKANNYYFSKSAQQIAACKCSPFAHNLLYSTEGRDIIVTWQQTAS